MRRILEYSISEAAKNLIVAESARALPNETGGILIGRVEDGQIKIESATPPGPAAEHSPVRFRRDGNFSQTLLDQAVGASKGEVDYIGEWHSHPIESHPSVIDHGAMRWIVNNKKYAIIQPIMLLATLQSENTWGLRVFVLRGKKLVLLTPSSS